jgi:hypothetical protein
MAPIGDLFTKYRSEKSFHGYDPKVLKSGIQKYARRGEVEKGLWCLIEMDLFSLLERNGAELNAYLKKYPNQVRQKTQTRAESIRTNMANRLVVMMSEEVNISSWWMPLKVLDLYEKWNAERGTVSSRKYLLDLYSYLTSQKMIRLISDIKSVFLLPPHYLEFEKFNDLTEIHNGIQAGYPEIYQNQKEIDEACETDLNRYPDRWTPCIAAIKYNLEIGSDNVFFWISKLFASAKTDIISKIPKSNTIKKLKIEELKKLRMEDLANQNKCAHLVWKILFEHLDHNEELKLMVPVIQALNTFYSKMTHKERPIYLYHAVLLIVRRKDIDWSSKPPQIDTPPGDISKRYNDQLNGPKMEMDDYILDIHTRQATRRSDSLETFAVEGAYIKNENNDFLKKEYRQIYILFKQRLDCYHSRGCKL